jgi:hypothetical protein
LSIIYVLKRGVAKMSVSDLSNSDLMKRVESLEKNGTKTDEKIDKIANLLSKVLVNQEVLNNKITAHNMVLKHIFGTTLCRTLRYSYYYIFYRAYYYKVYDDKLEKIVKDNTVGALK